MKLPLASIPALALSLLPPTAGAVTASYVPVADATLFSESGDLASGADDGVFVGFTRVSDNRRAILRFAPADIPANAIIGAVSLRLRVTRTIASPLPVEIHRVLVSWGEGTSPAPLGGGGGGGTATVDSATWLCRFYTLVPLPGCASLWSVPGGDVVATASASATAGNTNTTTTFSGPGLVADLQAWVAGATPNDGWLVRATNEVYSTNTAHRFGSRESTTSANRPVLEVTWELPPTPTRVPLGAAAAVALGVLLVAGARGWRGRS